MDRILDTSRWLLAVASGTLTALMGGWDAMLRVLTLFILADYITGIAAAWVQKRLSSQIGARGIVKKVFIFLVVMVAAQVDVLLAAAAQSVPALPVLPALCRSLVVCFYIANEGLSILENAGEAGVPIPAVLMDALAQLKKKGHQDADPSDTSR